MVNRLRTAAADLAAAAVLKDGKDDVWPAEIGFDPMLPLFGVLAVRISTADGRQRIVAATPASFDGRKRAAATHAMKAAWLRLLRPSHSIWRRAASAALGFPPFVLAILLLLPLSLFEAALTHFNTSGFGRPPGTGRSNGVAAFLLVFSMLP